jgi:hypothetical protein
VNQRSGLGTRSWLLARLPLPRTLEYGPGTISVTFPHPNKRDSWIRPCTSRCSHSRRSLWTRCRWRAGERPRPYHVINALPYVRLRFNANSFSHGDSRSKRSSLRTGHSSGKSSFLYSAMAPAWDREQLRLLRREFRLKIQRISFVYSSCRYRRYWLSTFLDRSYRARAAWRGLSPSTTARSLALKFDRLARPCDFEPVSAVTD